MLKAEDMHASEPDRAGHTIAVFLQSCEGRILRLQQIHLRAGDQIMKIPRRDSITLDRIGERGENGVSVGITSDAFIQQPAPAAQFRSLQSTFAHAALRTLPRIGNSTN